jgi:glycosyltransferase involved in cell wall biosynthesis
MNSSPLQGLPGSWISPEFVPGLVSVIIPTHNRAHLIGETLDSVLAQTYRPIECLVVDDASTDDTSEVVQSWASKAKHGFSIRYVRQEKGGAQVARNRGSRLARGEFVQYLDSDDLLMPNKLARQVKVLSQRGGVVAAYGSWRCLYEGRKAYHPGPLYCGKPMPSEQSMLVGYLSGSWFVPPHSYLFSRNALIATGPWDERISRGQDADYAVSALLAKVAFVHVAGAEVFYRRHQGDHIGSETNFRQGGLDAYVLCARKWASSEFVRGNAELRAALLRKLSSLKESAVLRGYSDGAQKCDEAAREIAGSGALLAKHYRQPSRCRMLAKRMLKNSLHSLFGEYRLSWIRSAIGGWLR